MRLLSRLLPRPPRHPHLLASFSPPLPPPAAFLSTSCPPLLPYPAQSPSLWYICGPTVYSSTHLGHARSYLLLDALCQAAGASYAMGVTDVDDKIVNAVSAGNPEATLADMANFTRGWERDFFSSLSQLNVRPPLRALRVSEHIPDIIKCIEKLVEQNVAYIGTDKSVYMSTAPAFTSYPYGLPGDFPQTRQPPPPPLHDTQPSPKRSPRDFALWKTLPPAALPPAAALAYPSPWGRGRPGWHIECSAFVEVLEEERGAGQPGVGCHGGGVDLQVSRGGASAKGSPPGPARRRRARAGGVGVT